MSHVGLHAQTHFISDPNLMFIHSERLIMARKFIDCREFPSDSHCSVAIAADTDQELLEAAVQHAVAVHKHEDTPELRQQITQLFREGTPPIECPVMQAL